MSPLEHRVAAESLLAGATSARYRDESKAVERMLLEAQVHAVLSLASPPADHEPAPEAGASGRGA